MKTKNTYKPKSLLVAGHKLAIEYRKDLDDFGQFNVDRMTIIIRDSLNPKETLSTIIHESVHAILALSGLSYLIDDESKEEALVRAIDYLLIPIIKRELKAFNES